MKTPLYKSFSSFTNLEAAQWALVLAAVNFRVGGILLSGKSGTGKSDLILSLNNILSDRKIIKLPLSITEESLCGTLDMKQTMKEGKRHYHKGILHNLHNNILFIDNINLLSAKILYLILQICEDGYFYTDDGDRNICNFTIIATMNPEEGGITTKTLDRFGLFMEMPNQESLSSRLEILKEQELWDKKPVNQLNIYSTDDNNWAKRISKGKELLPKVNIDIQDLTTIAQICKESFVAGHRGDLALLWAVVTYVALNGRTKIYMEDILKVKDWVLLHRIRSPKQSSANNNEVENNDKKQAPKPPKEPSRDNIDNEKPNNQSNSDKEDIPALPDLSDNKPLELTEDNPNEESFEIGDLQLNTDIIQNQAKVFDKREGTGKRIKCTYSEGKGRHIRSAKLRQKEISDIDFVATLRCAAPYQKWRQKNGLAIRIYKDDLHKKVREHRIGNTILFLVDASGSMGIKRRMEEAKAGVFSLLQDAYVHRDKLALMTFRKEKSELLLPPTRSISRAYTLLQDVKTGGRTPLYNGLQSALELLINMKIKDKDNVPIMVLFTDGKATSSYKGENTADKLQSIAQKYVDLKLKTILIDTECGFVKLGYAKRLAEWLQADYFQLDDLKEKELRNMI